MPGVARSLASSDSGRSERVRSDAPCWKTPKSERPTWIRSAAVRRTPAAIESSATISATPIATPAAVSPVRTDRRIRFRQTSPARSRPYENTVDESHTLVAFGHVFVRLRRYADRGWRVADVPTQGSSATCLRSGRSRRPGRGRQVRSVAMEPSRDEIWKALEQVIDPELRRPVTDLDMVREIAIDGGDVTVTIALTVAGCPLRASFQDQVARARRSRPRRRADGRGLRRHVPGGEGGADDEAPRRRRRALEGDRRRPLDARPRDRERQGRRRQVVADRQPRRRRCRRSAGASASSTRTSTATRSRTCSASRSGRSSSTR